MALRPPGGVSGLAVAIAAVGGVVMLSGLKNATISDTLRAIIKGKAVPSKASTLKASETAVTSGLGAAVANAVTGATAGTTGAAVGQAAANAVLGEQIVSAARAQIGKPYKWATDGPNSFDCSGLVSYVLRQVGVFKKGQRWVTGQFYVSPKFTTVPRSQIQAGDLICWTSHIAIAVSSKRMIHAPTFGQNVQEANIWWTGSPLVRRVKGA